ncbi:helix-turn-helix transcriptional regulator [Leuconostoc citreum]|uniref:helix-turn-helix transcriptional regulator n=1 Tax=Leuconostoc citreum TaxID=33964 RepID=UPI0032DF34C7
MTQKDLSSLIHVSRQTISNWEVERSYPDLESIVLLSNVFDCSLDSLLKDEPDIIRNINRNKIKNTLIKIVGILLSLGTSVSILVNFASEQTINWSLVPLSGSIFFMTFLVSVLKIPKFPLFSATLLSYVPLICIFLSIKYNSENMDIQILTKIVSLWFLYYVIIIYLVEMTKIEFYKILLIAASLSLPMEYLTRIIWHSDFSTMDLIIKVILIMVFGILCLIKPQGNAINKWLTKYRLYAYNQCVGLK